MDSSILKKTQDTLGKVISKPPLTEKLLSKPPFRFLHDVITEVIKKTNVLKGLFKSEELNSENVKDRDAKINFLQKAIDCVGMLVGESLAVKPSKIVAGHEPEKTNEFLQALGKACLKKMDSSESVKKVLAGEKPSSGKSRRKESAEKRSTSKDRSSERGEKGKESQKRDEKESKKKEDRKDTDSAKGKKSRDEREKSSAKEKEKQKEKEKEKGTEKEKEKDKSRGREKKKEETTKEKDNEPQEIEDTVGSRSVQRPASAKGQRRRPTNQEGEKENMPPSDDVDDQIQDIDEPNEKEQPPLLADDSNVRQQSAVRRMARPSSARPAPPKIKKNIEPEDSNQRLGSGKQFNVVIVDDPKDQDDDDDLFVVEENLQNEPYFEQVNTDNQPEVDDGQHGSLVKKMLDSKKEADIVQSKTQQSNEKPIIMDATRKKEKEIAQKEIERLRNSIQTLCRSAHPLGKVMDYLQEDIDSMQKELEMWQKENRQHSMALKAEQSITESETEPLQAQLGELELVITDMIDKISSVKSNIIRNDEKIRDLVSGISR